MNRSSSRRALVVLAVILLALLAATDLARRDSFLRSLWGGDGPSRQEEVIQEMQRRGLPAPAPHGSALLEPEIDPTGHDGTRTAVAPAAPDTRSAAPS